MLSKLDSRIDDDDAPLILELLGKDEDELLQTLWGFQMDRSFYPPKIANFNAENVMFTD